MVHLNEKIKIISVNQMNVYHTLIEAYNIIMNSSSEKIRSKWSDNPDNEYFLRSEKEQKVPKKPKKKCTGFSYCGAKLFNKLPSEIKETKNSLKFKSLTKAWIGKNIPAY